MWQKKDRAELTVRLPIILGLASLFAGLLFAGLAHYLLVVNNRSLLQKSITRQLAPVLQQGAETSPPLLLKKIQNLFPQESEGEVYLFKPQGKVVGWNRLDSDLSEATVERAQNIFLKLMAKTASQGLRYSKFGGQVHLLFGIPEQDSRYFLLFVLPEEGRVVQIILIFYTLALLFSAILTITGFIIAREIQEPLATLHNAIETKAALPDITPINYREIAALVNSVHNLLTLRGNSLPYQTSAPGTGQTFGGAMTEESQKNDDPILYLQKTLFEKPFSRLKNFELALYPRTPSINSENFLGAHEESGFLDIFCGHFDLNDLEANLWKHRLQEKFYAVSAGVPSLAKTVESLWQSMFGRVDIGPGMLYLRLEENNLKVFRAGPFHIFGLINSRWEPMGNGETFFSSNFSSEDIAELALPNGLLVATQDILDILETDPEAFAEILGEATNMPAKSMVGAVAEKIYGRLKAADGVEVTGFVLGIRRKS